ncbi:chemotaxis protein CheX [Xylanimonas oleitrophica]|uniref:Chemotaxis protein CheX n=1 Tax=Xylanimonas oleitrophica TaxID=2607479 RepID=A0A2W5X1J6_9MICO|nr:chemotaxis protein CheX [Xylanimonas oleitrophica]PZR54155.1 chemotaxis protein CheX [Xylanimonas oleitrophica]
MSPIAVGEREIFEIAREVFDAMIPGGGALEEWHGDLPVQHEPLTAWVAFHGPFSGRAVLSSERGTVDDLASALLGLGPDAVVGDEDRLDAFGEIANMVGGNLKSLLPFPGTLGLPEVAAEPPADGVLLEKLRLSWGGRPIVITLWSTDSAAAALSEGSTLQ